MINTRTILGTRGERRAARFLRKQGYRIVTRNYRCPLGEIDLIALDGKAIVFVEVKTRSDRLHADPQDAVTPAKQRRIIRAAKTFVQQTHSQGRACRFDVVTVTTHGWRNCQIEHFVNAFTI